MQGLYYGFLKMDIFVFHEIPNVRLQIPLAPIAEPEDRELRALNDFILLKERHIARYMDIEKNLLAIEATDRFISYLKDFPLQNHFEAASRHFGLFWKFFQPYIVQVPQEVQPLDSQVMNILQSLPPVMETSYFGPRSQMPRGHRIRGSSNNVRGQGRRREGNVEQVDEQINGGQTNERQGNQGREQGGRVRGGRGRGRSERQGNTSNLIISNDDAIDRFSTFDPHQDVKVGMVIAMETDDIDRHLGIHFFVAKVLSLSQQACENGVANVLWYQPKMPRGLQDEEGKFHNRYTNCIQRAWEPSREPHGCIPITGG